MKKIYIVLSYTGTILAKAIKIYTRKEYSHVSISLDEKMNNMYSFGRLNPYIPFWGGFVQESPHFGTFKRFNKSKIIVYSMEVSDDDYQNIKKTIESVRDHRQDYHFNVMGLVTAIGHYPLKRDKCFYCAEFVKYVLENSNLELDLPEFIRPDDFRRMQGLDVVLVGMLCEYNTL